MISTLNTAFRTIEVIIIILITCDTCTCISMVCVCVDCYIRHFILSECVIIVIQTCVITWFMLYGSSFMIKLRSMLININNNYFIQQLLPPQQPPPS